MTHKKVWTAVAEAFGTPPNQRTEEQRLMCRYGLCHAAQRCRPPYKYVMVYVLWNFQPYDGMNDLLWFPANTTKSDNLRCLYACLFAAMTEGEFNEVTKGDDDGE